MAETVAVMENGDLIGLHVREISGVSQAACSIRWC